MNKEKTVKKEKPVLLIAYFQRNGEVSDSCIFVGDENHKKTFEEQFIAYAKRQKWGVDEEDIEGVYTCTMEEDFKGREFKINVKLINNKK